MRQSEVNPLPDLVPSGPADLQPSEAAVGEGMGRVCQTGHFSRPP